MVSGETKKRLNELSTKEPQVAEANVQPNTASKKNTTAQIEVLLKQIKELERQISLLKAEM